MIRRVRFFFIEMSDSCTPFKIAVKFPRPKEHR